VNSKGQMFLSPVKHKILLGSFLNQAGESMIIRFYTNVWSSCGSSAALKQHFVLMQKRNQVHTHTLPKTCLLKVQFANISLDCVYSQTFMVSSKLHTKIWRDCCFYMQHAIARIC